jgi:hypothetical protein
VNFLFDGGRITHEWAQQHLQLASDELSTWRLASAAEWAELMEPHMARRLDACAPAAGHRQRRRRARVRAGSAVLERATGRDRGEHRMVLPGTSRGDRGA